MSRASVLARGRAAAALGMVDSCTIRRRTSQSTDPNTGVTTAIRSTVYSGKCRVQQRGIGGARPEQDVGEAYQLMLQLELQLPMSVTGLRVGDEVTITASVNDADLVGRVFRIRDLAHKSEATARRVGVQEVT